MTPDIAGILEDVVHQFSDPFAFFRELVQNSLDAGTGEIEITVEFEPEEGVDTGLLIASVQDFGCGMSREVVETQLCRLFSSAKYGDLTKIGRFGIGFVSVYGVEPDWVCVDTGRDGESWRIIFLPDRSYELRALRTPCEGTLVRVAKSMTREEAAEFEQRAREVLQSWCAHIAVPVTFAGEDLRQPFEIASPCAIEFEESGTRAVVGLVHERHGAASYYNRGLLLQERDRSPWAHVAFKIDSRLLEHTLTRDDLLHDRGYHRVVETLEELATRRLPKLLIAELEDAARTEASGPREHELWSLLGAVSAANTVRGWANARIVPTLDGPKSVAELRTTPALFASPERTALAEAVNGIGQVVILTDVDVARGAFGLRAKRLDAAWVSLDARSWSEHAGGQALVPQLRAALREWDIVPERVWLGSWDGASCVACDDPEHPIRHSELAVPRLAKIDGRHLVLNLSDPVVRQTLELPAACIDIAVAALLREVDRNRAVDLLIRTVRPL